MTAAAIPEPGGGRSAVAANGEQRSDRARELLVAALAYAVAGWPVLPVHTPTAASGCSCGHADCQSAGKHPRTRRGLRDATTDPHAITAWWSRWPDANVAVRTGAVVVLDVDGHHGARSLQALEARHAAIPPTRRARTARGWHLYFRAGELEVGNSAGLLGPGLDVRGRGGYVVAPPSWHAIGERYAWAGEHELAPLPGWLAELLTDPSPQTPARTPLPEAVIGGGGGRSRRYLQAALDDELTGVARAAVGTRNATLNRAAFRLGQLAGAGLGSGEQIADALVHAAARCGLGEREARATIASGLRAGYAHPRRIGG
jgi:hypothetical protein